MAKPNEARDRFRRRAYTIGEAEFSLCMKSVDLTTLQNLAQFDPAVPEHLRHKQRARKAQTSPDCPTKRESKRKAKSRLRARKHAMEVMRQAAREQGAKDYSIAGDSDCLAQVIMY
jgi:pyruvate/2-oxoglutarate dehydrogenase complex dihydrolipoamide acyltransferase (E2) component